MVRHLEVVSLPRGQVLNEAGAPFEFVYFPINCMVSMVAVVDGRNTLEVGLAGRDGMVGVPLALGVLESPARAVVQGRGSALRMPQADFSAELKRNAALRAEAHRYAYISMATAMFLAACNKAHGFQLRLARWLLMTRDCLSTDTFELTQEFLGQMLGTGRPSVNAAATGLQERRLISYRRGVIRLLDIPGLQVAACLCYGKIRQLTSTPLIAP